MLTPLIEHRRELAQLGRVLRLDDRDRVRPPVVDAQHRKIQLVAERRLDVALIVETLGQLDRAEQILDRRPLRGVEVRVDADERKRARRNELRGIPSELVGRGGAAATACCDEQETGCERGCDDCAHRVRW